MQFETEQEASVGTCEQRDIDNYNATQDKEILTKTVDTAHTNISESTVTFAGMADLQKTVFLGPPYTKMAFFKSWIQKIRHSSPSYFYVEYTSAFV